ncbi:hypothetical protein SAMN05421837_104129 [Amycolatopsis pretoriensis]|uniref:HNH endonuclease n=1 Tax=Amycolatopsis pretoriensis TaxID=218821 RepID=A0A1H5QRA9_9PSEU|nr:hypothetical protein [Amycolatopsis pretoriensis]SEF28364.1 hypothetical protein SAMN05421837_104129 [Amycolatopsis pretoriensis]
MKRVALWLLDVVGEGNEFTKEEMRAAFPGVSQIDRRMRDLRSFGWRIDTNREDPSLTSAQQRFVESGQPVWEKGMASRPQTAAAIGAVRRREIISRDGNMCRSCGIAPGDLYPETFEGAQLDIARRDVELPDGSVEQQLVTECKKCRIGAKDLVVDLPAVIDRVNTLAPDERKLLASWMDAEQRPFNPAERAWSEYKTLPADARAAVRGSLG